MDDSDTLEGRKRHLCAWVSFDQALTFSVDDASIHARVARQSFQMLLRRVGRGASC